MVVSRCWLCETEGESVDYLLLLHCAAARGLWNAFFAWFGLCWVLPRFVKELFVSWWTGGRMKSALLFERWSLIVLCGVFGGSEIIDVLRTRRGLEKSSSISFLLLFTWTIGWLASRVISFVDFLSFFSISP